MFSLLVFIYVLSTRARPQLVFYFIPHVLHFCHKQRQTYEPYRQPKGRLASHGLLLANKSVGHYLDDIGNAMMTW